MHRISNDSCFDQTPITRNAKNRARVKSEIRLSESTFVNESSSYFQDPVEKYMMRVNHPVRSSLNRSSGSRDIYMVSTLLIHRNNGENRKSVRYTVSVMTDFKDRTPSQTPSCLSRGLIKASG